MWLHQCACWSAVLEGPDVIDFCYDADCSASFSVNFLEEGRSGIVEISRGAAGFSTEGARSRILIVGQSHTYDSYVLSLRFGWVLSYSEEYCLKGSEWEASTAFGDRVHLRCETIAANDAELMNLSSNSKVVYARSNDGLEYFGSVSDVDGNLLGWFELDDLGHHVKHALIEESGGVPYRKIISALDCE